MDELDLTMPYQAQGKKEIAEAVVIAALSALATGLVNWLLDRAKKAAEKQDEDQQ